jgi:hypothetical protein
MGPESRLCRLGRALVLLPVLAMALPANSANAQSSGSGVGENRSTSWVAFSGALDLHMAGDQASLMALRSDSELSGAMAHGVRIEVEAGRRLKGVWVSLQAGGSYHAHEDGPGSFEVSGNTKSAKAALAFGIFQPDRRVNAELGIGVLYLHSETVASPAGGVIGMPAVNAGLRVQEWAPLVNASTIVRLLGDGSGPSVGLRLGVEVAATQDQPTVRVPVGLRVRFAR